MKKLQLYFLLLLIFSFLCVYTQGQQTPAAFQSPVQIVTATSGSTVGFNTNGSTAQYWLLTVNTSGTVTTGSVRVDSSADPLCSTGWNTGDVIAAQTVAGNTNISFISTNIVVNCVRMTWANLTGTGATLSMVVTGYTTLPATNTIVLTGTGAGTTEYTQGAGFSICPVANSGCISPNGWFWEANSIEPAVPFGFTMSQTAPTIPGFLQFGTPVSSGGIVRSPVQFGQGTGCANGSSPAVCGNNIAGFVAVPTGATPTLQVNTTAVTANSRILLTIDESATIGGTTCNTSLSTLVQPVVTARSAGSSFTMQINATLATNPACVSFLIIN